MRTLAASAAMAAFLMPLPASAAVTVIGSSAARACYEAARSPRKSADGIERCNTAFESEALTRQDMVATHVNRGILRISKGDVQGALADYDAALALNPREPEAWLNKAFAYLRNGDARGALPFFDSAVALKTREPAMAHYGRGIAHEEVGNARAAYSDYLRARELTPEWDAPARELSRFRVRATKASASDPR